MKRFFTITLCFLLLQISVRAGNVSSNGIPDFREMLQKLTVNQLEYNKYNDSIFLIHDHNEWVEFFFRRSKKNKEIYQDNAETLNRLYNYFEKPTAAIPDAAYDSLYNACMGYLGTTTPDPFISKRLSTILVNHYKNTENGKVNRPMVWLSQAYYDTYIMTKDKNTLSKSYELMKYAADSTHIHTLEDYGIRGYALENLAVTVWANNNLQTPAEYKEICQQLWQLANNNSVLKAINIPPKTVERWKSRAVLADENIVRNIYLVNENSVSKSFGDSVLHAMIKRMEHSKSLSFNSLVRLHVMKVKAGEIATEKALKICLDKYAETRRILKKVEFQDQNFNNFMRQYTDLIYLNDIANIPERQKRKNTKLFCHDIITAFQRRKDEQGSISYIKSLILLSTYQRLISHLTEDERVDFLLQMIVNTQVTTYAHSQHVAEMAKVLTEGIIKHKPEMFLGYLGLQSVKNVRKYQEAVKYYLYRAAVLHDLGKNDIVSVVNNNYRPLNDEEYNIIKMHPQLGLKYLEIAPSLSPFHDTTLGHHKWYNGKGGYPEDFDNTKSRRRFLIDIITLCDCMQAATEKLGRNYRKEKSFETVMEELKQGAGTRYNPELVKLIEDYPDVQATLKKVTIDGWLDIYYNIHKRYFR